MAAPDQLGSLSQFFQPLRSTHSQSPKKKPFRTATNERASELSGVAPRSPFGCDLPPSLGVPANIARRSFRATRVSCRAAGEIQCTFSANIRDAKLNSGDPRSGIRRCSAPEAALALDWVRDSMDHHGSKGSRTASYDSEPDIME